MRVFLDANILFSAAKSQGAIATLVQLLLEKGHECWVDDFVITEARRNLAAKWPKELNTFEALLGSLQTDERSKAAASHEAVNWLPLKDRPVLLGAMRLQCNALVTGDRTHFGSGYGKSFEGVTIYSPRSLTEYISDDSRSQLAART